MAATPVRAAPRPPPRHSVSVAPIEHAAARAPLGLVCSTPISPASARHLSMHHAVVYRVSRLRMYGRANLLRLELPLETSTIGLFKEYIDAGSTSAERVERARLFREYAVSFTLASNFNVSVDAQFSCLSGDGMAVRELNVEAARAFSIGSYDDSLVVRPKDLLPSRPSHSGRLGRVDWCEGKPPGECLPFDVLLSNAWGMEVVHVTNVDESENKIEFKRAPVPINFARKLVKPQGTAGRVPVEWRCFPSQFGGQDGCHCECGAYDPDCSQRNSAPIGCGPGQQCSLAGVCTYSPLDTELISISGPCKRIFSPLESVLVGFFGNDDAYRGASMAQPCSACPEDPLHGGAPQLDRHLNLVCNNAAEGWVSAAEQAMLETVSYETWVANNASGVVPNDGAKLISERIDISSTVAMEEALTRPTFDDATIFRWLPMQLQLHLDGAPIGGFGALSQLTTSTSSAAVPRLVLDWDLGGYSSELLLHSAEVVNKLQRNPIQQVSVSSVYAELSAAPGKATEAVLARHLSSATILSAVPSPNSFAGSSTFIVVSCHKAIPSKLGRSPKKKMTLAPALAPKRSFPPNGPYQAFLGGIDEVVTIMRAEAIQPPSDRRGDALMLLSLSRSGVSGKAFGMSGKLDASVAAGSRVLQVYWTWPMVGLVGRVLCIDVDMGAAGLEVVTVAAVVEGARTSLLSVTLASPLLRTHAQHAVVSCMPDEPGQQAPTLFRYPRVKVQLGHGPRPAQPPKNDLESLSAQVLVTTIPSRPASPWDEVLCPETQTPNSRSAPTAYQLRMDRFMRTANCRFSARVRFRLPRETTALAFARSKSELAVQGANSDG